MTKSKYYIIFCFCVLQKKGLRVQLFFISKQSILRCIKVSSRCFNFYEWYWRCCKIKINAIINLFPHFFFVSNVWWILRHFRCTFTLMTKTHSMLCVKFAVKQHIARKKRTHLNLVKKVALMITFVCYLKVFCENYDSNWSPNNLIHKTLLSFLMEFKR